MLLMQYIALQLINNISVCKFISYSQSLILSQCLGPVFCDDRVLVLVLHKDGAELVQDLQQLVPGAVLKVHHLLNVMLAPPVFAEPEQKTGLCTVQVIMI